MLAYLERCNQLLGDVSSIRRCIVRDDCNQIGVQVWSAPRLLVGDRPRIPHLTVYGEGMVEND